MHAAILTKEPPSKLITTKAKLYLDENSSKTKNIPANIVDKMITYSEKHVKGLKKVHWLLGVRYEKFLSHHH